MEVSKHLSMVVIFFPKDIYMFRTVALDDAAYTYPYIPNNILPVMCTFDRHFFIRICHT